LYHGALSGFRRQLSKGRANPAAREFLTGLGVSATCIRVPVLRAHSMSITFECEAPIAPDRVHAIPSMRRQCAGRRAGRCVCRRIANGPERNYFPMPCEAPRP